MNKLKSTMSSNEMIVVYLIAALSLLIGFVNSRFLGAATVINLSRSMLVMLIFAMCEMLVIISGGIDVSFPAIACTALYSTVKIMRVAGIDSILFAFLFATLIGGVFGLLNAILIAKLNLPPLIATLGVSSLLNGGSLAFIGSTEITGLSSSLNALSQTFLFTYTNREGIQYSLTILILVPVILCVALHFILKYTMLGRGVYAIGGDANAARIAGFCVTRIRFIVYIFSGCFAGIGGIIYAILMRQANPQVLMGSEMLIIAATVIGGVRITGGHGSAVGTILGVILLVLIQNNLIMLGVPTHFQTLVIGLIIGLGTTITSLKAKRIANSIKI